MSQDLLKWARRYNEVGLNIIPCRDKVPAIKWKKYQKKKVKKKKIEEWFSVESCEFNGYNGIALITGSKSGVMVIDADSASGIKWCDNNLPVPGFRQKTRKGKHYFYKSSAGLKNAADIFGEKKTHGKFENGSWKGRIVDVRAESGIIILYPSPNYDIEGDVDAIRSIPFPETELRNGGYMGRLTDGEGDRVPDVERCSMGPKELSIRLGDISGLLVHIPPDERLSEPDWRKIGAAIHFESGGAEEGRELFRAWSSGALHGLTHKNFNDSEVDAKWAGYSNGGAMGSKVRIGTIAKISRDYKTMLAKSGGVGADEDEISKMLSGITNMAAQMTKIYDPVEWCVKKFIPIGLTLLAGRPKVGKSFVCLDLCNSVALGTNVFDDMEVVHGTTLYISMEDHGRRITSRLKDMGLEGSDKCLLVHETPQWDSGMAEFIRAIKARHIDLNLVVVDTLVHCLPPKPGNTSDYEYYYPVISGMQRLAHELGIALVLVHHAKKGGSGAAAGGAGAGGSDNVFDQILGSVALQGAADSLMVITRRPSESEGFFVTTSRDFGDMIYNMYFDEECLRWKKQDQGPVASYNENDRAIGWAIYNSIDKCLQPLQIHEQTGIPIKTIRTRLNKQGSYFEQENGTWKIAPAKKQVSVFSKEKGEADNLKNGLTKDGKKRDYKHTKKRRNKKKNQD